MGYEPSPVPNARAYAMAPLLGCEFALHTRHAWQEATLSIGIET